MNSAQVWDCDDSHQMCCKLTLKLVTYVETRQNLLGNFLDKLVLLDQCDR